jgi:hypothetical protein
MIAQAVHPQQEGSSLAAFSQAAGALSDGDISLLLDCSGRITGRTDLGTGFFGKDHAEMVGRRIGEFLPGLFAAGASPSFSARFLAHLCSCEQWQRLEAIDSTGARFAVELCLSRTEGNGGEFYALQLRPAEREAGSFSFNDFCG